MSELELPMARAVLLPVEPQNACRAGLSDAWHELSVTNILALLSMVTASSAVVTALRARAV